MRCYIALQKYTISVNHGLDSMTLEYIIQNHPFRTYLFLWLFTIGVPCLSIGQEQKYTAQAGIECLNNPFQSDIVFVTNPDANVSLRCNTHVTGTIPSDYQPESSIYEWNVTSGTIDPREDQAVWVSPEPGLQTAGVKGKLVFKSIKSSGFFSRSSQVIEIPFNASVQCLIPYRSKDKWNVVINGQQIGKYPDPSNPSDLTMIDTETSRSNVKNHPDRYQPPELFYAVTPQTYRLKIFRNYSLGDFDLDPRFMEVKYPRYIAIHPNLLRKLGLLEDMVKVKGHTITKFKIFYGFRSPEYNLGARDEDGSKTLKTSFSMHMYGLAADMIIDEDNDLVMDDLNGDKKSDIKDAQLLLQYVNELDKTLREQGSELLGGAGWYYHHDFWERGEYAQSPYVHIDARGFTSANGTLVRWVGKDTIGVTKQKNPYRLKKPIPQWPF